MFRYRKITLILFIGIVAISIFISIYYFYNKFIEKHYFYGPITFKIETDDNKILTDVVVQYHAAVYSIESARTITKETYVVETGTPIILKRHEVESIPSYFQIKITHPLYSGAQKNIRRKNLDDNSHGEIDFGVIKLTNLGSAFSDPKYSDHMYPVGHIESRITSHLADVKNNYLPAILDKSMLLNGEYYTSNLLELCNRLDALRNIEVCSERTKNIIHNLF